MPSTIMEAAVQAPATEHIRLVAMIGAAHRHFTSPTSIGLEVHPGRLFQHSNVPPNLGLGACPPPQITGDTRPLEPWQLSPSWY